MTDGDNRCWRDDADAEDGFAGRILTYDDFLNEYVEQPTWRQLVGNALIKLALRFGTTFDVDLTSPPR